MLKKIFIPFLFFTAALAQQPNNEGLNNRFMLAQSFEQAGDFERAKGIYEELYKLQPENYQFFDALNRVYTQLKDYDTSIKLIEVKIETSEPNINFYGLLGSSYYLKGDEEKAFEVWDEAFEKLPRNPMNYRILANYSIERRAFEEAVKLLERGRDASDNPESFSSELANLYTFTMRFKEAAEEYCLILSKEPEQLQIVESKMLSYIYKPGALDETIDVVEDYRSNEIIGFSYLLARLYLERGDYYKTFETYLDIDSRQNNQGTDLYNFATLAFNNKEYVIAAKAFNEIIENYSNSPVISSAKLGYAKTMEEALDENISDTSQSWKPYHSYNLNKENAGSIDSVIAAYFDLTKIYPHSEVAAESFLRIGKICFYKKNDPEAAEESFVKVISDFRVSRFAFDAEEDLAEINLIKGDLEKAEEYLNEIIGNRSAPEEKKNNAKFDLARIEFFKNNFDSAKNLLNEILNNMKDNTANDAIEMSLLLNTKMSDSTNLMIYSSAELLAAQKKFNEAVEKYKLLSANPQAFILQKLAKIKEAEMHLALNNYGESVKLLEQVSDEYETNIYADKALYLLGKIYQFGYKDGFKAIEMYEKLLAKFPNSLYLDEVREEILKLRNKLS
jgi:tetratricopeptide (TPR) repeat protein